MHASLGGQIDFNLPQLLLTQQAVGLPCPPPSSLLLLPPAHALKRSKVKSCELQAKVQILLCGGIICSTSVCTRATFARAIKMGKSQVEKNQRTWRQIESKSRDVSYWPHHHRHRKLLKKAKAERAEDVDLDAPVCRHLSYVFVLSLSPFLSLPSSACGNKQKMCKMSRGNISS